MSASSARPNKRSPAEIDVDSAPGESVSRDELDGMLQELRSSLAEEITTAVNQKCVGQFERMIRSYDTKVQDRLTDHDATLADLSRRIAASEAEQANTKGDLVRLQRALAVAESAAADATRAINEDEFDRNPDPTILRCNLSESVSRDAVRAALAPLMEDASIAQDQWEIPGPPAGIARNFVVSFKGTAGLAARRARKVLDMRRLASGEWRPNPQVTTPLNRAVDVYISPDKSPKQLRTEQGGRKLFKAFKAVHAGKTSHLDKKTGMVSIDWHPCAKVIPNPEPNSWVVQWNPSVVARASIDKPSVMAAFNAGTGSAAGVQWEI